MCNIVTNLKPKEGEASPPVSFWGGEAIRQVSVYTVAVLTWGTKGLAYLAGFNQLLDKWADNELHGKAHLAAGDHQGIVA
ncbi:Uncharacterised protein [Grimontia hollisae]|nr:Uncharacterised protein [Grimontia hollisae]